jgi:hypothetical protein
MTFLCALRVLCGSIDLNAMQNVASSIVLLLVRAHQYSE